MQQRICISLQYLINVKSSVWYFLYISDWHTSLLNQEKYIGIWNQDQNVVYGTMAAFSV